MICLYSLVKQTAFVVDILWGIEDVDACKSCYMNRVWMLLGFSFPELELILLATHLDCRKELIGDEMRRADQWLLVGRLFGVLIRE